MDPMERKRRDTEAYLLARQGEFSEGPVVHDQLPRENDDDREEWWDRWLNEVA